MTFRSEGGERVYSYSKLKGRIVERYGTQVNFARRLGISKNSISKKLTCNTEFSQSDIIRRAELLGIEKGLKKCSRANNSYLMASILECV